MPAALLFGVVFLCFFLLLFFGVEKTCFIIIRALLSACLHIHPFANSSICKYNYMK